MQLTSLIAAAGLAASASNAFILPFPAESSENDIVSTLPVPVRVEPALPQAAASQNLKLNCPGCPVRGFGHGKGTKGGPRMRTDIPSHLEFDFSIDHAPGADRLLLNGLELFPTLPDHDLGAPLVPDVPHRQKKRPDHRHHKHLMQSLGFGLHVQPVAKSEDDKLELITADLQIIEVGNVFVDGIPNVRLNLIRTPENGLLIANIETTASETSQKTPMDKQEECTTMLCKWRAVVMQQLGRLRAAHKGCGGRPGQVNGQLEGVHKHHGHHMHHGHRAQWGQLFKNIASHILLPIAVGIAAGVAASILGMMVGTAIVCLWRTFFRPAGARRHHKHGHSCHKAAQQETAIADEKAGLMAHGEEDIEAPPVYVEEGVVEEDKKTEN